MASTSGARAGVEMWSRAAGTSDADGSRANGLRELLAMPDGDGDEMEC